LRALDSAFAILLMGAALLIPGCKGGGAKPGAAASDCDGACAQQVLSAAEVERILAQAVAEASAQGLRVTVAVVDRVGNVLAVFRMCTGACDPVDNPGDAALTTVIVSGRNTGTGLDGLVVESALAAISKAGTAAYLSSQGNAFSTRTASQIVQENFNPGERVRAGGPLFGVQFSQLPCGDFVRRFERDGALADGTLGPKRMPLGFAADPGGLPLYEFGVPVGGVGVELGTLQAPPAAAGVETYTADLDVLDRDTQLEERIATAAAAGFAAPSNRRANAIAVDGRFLRFADDEAVATQPIPATAATPLSGLPGFLVDVDGFFDAASAVNVAGDLVAGGTQFLSVASGIVASSVGTVAAEVIVDAGGTPRFDPAITTTAAPAPPGIALTAAEVNALLRNALLVAGRSRAQIRRPAGSSVRVNISVVDTEGKVLGFARTPDAPIFGADVSLQKARAAAFLSKTTAAADLAAARPPLQQTRDRFRTRSAAEYLSDLRDFLGLPGAPNLAVLSDGTAISDRAVGNLARPFFPDGVNGNPPGPISRPFAEWSPFSTGLQLDAGLEAVAVALCRSSLEIRTFLASVPGSGVVASDSTTCPVEPIACTDAFGQDPALAALADPALRELANGLQIFPGSVPIYRNDELVGGIGISGDGVDQDDMVAFLGLYQTGVELPASGLHNAPAAIRADQVFVPGFNLRLRYVSCPPSPFLDSDEQEPCNGI
jgi:uncharacterized protein GlcG (DUF336 family)